jgi:hypothetical protein
VIRSLACSQRRAKEDREDVVKRVSEVFMQTLIPKQIQMTLSLASLFAAGLVGGWTQSSVALADVAAKSEPVMISARAHSAISADSMSPHRLESAQALNRSHTGNSARYKTLSEQTFAIGEIAHYEDLIATLTERVEQEEDPVLIDKIQTGIASLSHDIELSQKAVLGLKRADGVKEIMFAKEDVHEALLAMQDSGAALLKEIINSDRALSSQGRTFIGSEKQLPPPASPARQLVTSAGRD